MIDAPHVDPINLTPLMTIRQQLLQPPLMQQPSRGMANHRHKKIVKMAKGYRGRTNCFRIAVQRVEKALQYAYRDRKVRGCILVGGGRPIVRRMINPS